MIIEITISGTAYQIDTDSIIYGYNDTTLHLALSQIGINHTPAAEIFENNIVNSVSVPTYADFVTATANYFFLECASTDWTVINVNLLRIKALEVIDSSNTTIIFSKYNTVNVNVGIATLATAINNALSILTANTPITPATKTKITYDANGLVTAGADATTADIADSSNKRYVTDAQLVVIGNTSGTNSGNETVNTIGALINGASSATPNDTDLVMSVESSVAKKNTWTQLKTFLKTHFDSFYATIANLALKANIASPTFTGTVTIPNGSNLGTPTTLVATNASGTASGLTAGNVTTNANLTGPITSVGNATSIASQTGTGTKFVVDNTPTLITPILGVAKATSINTGTTLNGSIFAKSANLLSLISTDHSFTAGNEATGLNLAFGLYSTSLGIQPRNNGAASNLFLAPLGGSVAIGDGSLTGQRLLLINNTGTGTGDYAAIEIRNGASAATAFRMFMMGSSWTTSGMNKTNYAVASAGTSVSGLSIGTQGSAPIEIYTNNAQRIVIDSAGDLTSSKKLVSTGGGVGYATGAGGTATQGTSRTTTVVNNKLCGTITMFSAAQAANALVTFTLTNSFIESTDFILVQHISATNGGAWNISVVAGAGSATINIRNVSTGSITEATPLRFAIIKAVNT